MPFGGLSHYVEEYGILYSRGLYSSFQILYSSLRILTWLSAIDPDEGLNGQVTYAIKGETAGTLFNVDPRTGLLYLESQIPRQYITNGKHEVNSNNNNNNNDNQLSNLAQISTYPTFLLSLDACDQGEPRRCTHFPNLQIQAYKLIAS
ncbi:unnamed protein product [Trichobilharzia regenti]|nr:unnamed protein product [Trichobilharzia regenti]